MHTHTITFPFRHHTNKWVHAIIITYVWMTMCSMCACVRSTNKNTNTSHKWSILRNVLQERNLRRKKSEINKYEEETEKLRKKTDHVCFCIVWIHITFSFWRFESNELFSLPLFVLFVSLSRCRYACACQGIDFNCINESVWACECVCLARTWVIGAEFVLVCVLFLSNCMLFCVRVPVVPIYVVIHWFWWK